MKSVVISQYGSNDIVQIVDLGRPEPQAGEVLVRIHAAGVNPIDWKVRGGAGERLGLTLPIRLGSEVAGTVEALGPGAAGFEPGDAVYGIVKSGGFAEYVAVPAVHLATMPAGGDFVRAAALPLAGLTAWQAMFDLAGLAAGQRLLVTGSSGGVGSLAVQLAKDRGAHVTAVASARNADFVRSLGADAFVDYTAGPFERAARDMDVVFDTVGGDAFERAFHTLKPDGFLVTAVAFPKDEAQRHGVRVARAFTEPNAAQLGAIRDLAEAGRLAPHVAVVLPLSQVREALALSEGGRTRGKIVLRVLP